MSKTTFLAELQHEQAQWEALLAAIGEARMDQPGVAGPWAVKDIVAHLTGWRERTVARLQAAQRDAPVPPQPWPPELQTDDAINEWIYTANHQRSVQEVLADSRRVYDQLFATLAAFPDPEQLDFANYGFEMEPGQPITGAAFFAHFHEEHEPDMRAWLARQMDGASAT